MDYWSSLSTGISAIRKRLPSLSSYLPASSSETTVPSNTQANTELNDTQARRSRPSLASSLDLGSLPLKIEDTRCVQCGKWLEKPRTLQCGHRACTTCCNNLVDINAASILRCPVRGCEQATAVDDGIDSLPIDDDVVALVEHFKRMEQAERDSPGGSLIDITISSDRQIQPSKLPEGGAADTFGFVLLETTAAELTPAEAAEEGCGFLKFVYSRTTLAANTTAWMQNLYLAPSDLLAHAKLSDADAYYVPFYLFDVQTRSTVTAAIPPEQTTSSSNDEAAPPPPQQIERSYHHSYEEVLMCASYVLNPDLIRTLLKPPGKSSRTFPASSLEPFKSDSTNEKEKILSIDVDASDAWKSKEDMFRNQLEPAKCREALLKELPTATEIDVAVEIASTKHSLILLPFYHTRYTYADVDYEILMSGWNGGIDGTRPYGWGTAGRIATSIYGVVKDNL
eukprot:TRINITY_DN10145_c0_g1_i1.p1 TRINITY_DN10145_c0_g1~~TRINITY_DN10145_c0_g1_i1.p1  ORF type:complete len:453 (+),score=80.09 TRINITY_DN10145_c0_g1_i1:55-1413(+)